MYGYIYLTTCTCNGKKYIGQHKASKFEPEKYIGSGVILQSAIAKYGKEHFKVTLLKECFSRAELDASEIMFISQYDAVKSEDFYNILPGGNSHDDNSRAYISSRIKNKRWVNNGDINCYIEKEQLDEYVNAGWKPGKLPPDETGRKRMSESARARGNCLTEDGLKRCVKYGEENGFYGKQHSAETKAHLHAIHEGRIWVNNSFENRHIHANELEQYLANGYEVGMKERYDRNRSRIWIHNNQTQVRTMIYEDEFSVYESQGYALGYGSFRKSQSSTTIESIA